MQIVSIRPTHFGPFVDGPEIKIEKDVTVLTGANDAGKSAVLRLLQKFCERSPAAESDVNRNRLFTFGRDWKEDSGVGGTVSLQFAAEDDPQHWVESQKVGRGENVAVTVSLASAAPAQTVFRGARAVGRLIRTPKALVLPTEVSIRNEIPIAAPNTVERPFLEAAFGEFSVEKFNGMSAPTFESFIRQAASRLRAKAAEVLPHGFGYDFAFASVAGDHSRLLVQVIDQERGFTPIESRGTGAKKLLTLLGILTAADLANGHHLVLFDEPENSLHADAQRRLRQLLERVGSRPNVQVIYSTHSPVMINTLYPDRIRLVKRVQLDNERAAAAVTTPASNWNYDQVRTSLGIIPSDSLLFADVGLIVEGDTEARTLPVLLMKLHRENVDGFDRVMDILSNIHIINGGGDSFDKIARIAVSQGCRPIIFLDGDKKQRARIVGNRSELSDVPIAELAEGTELEELVRRESYIAGIALAHGLDKSKATLNAFDEWRKNEGVKINHFERRMFSKQVESWIEAEFETHLSKPAALKAAVEIEDVSNIQQIDALRNLVKLLSDRLGTAALDA